MSTRIGRILPEGVRAAESTGEPADAGLYPSEARAVAGATAGRRREFAAARACAHAALSLLGLAEAPVGRARDGSPGWPAGVVGSITHCAGYRAAAVASRTEVAAVGIDAEPTGPLRDGLMDVIALPSERRHHERLRRTAPGVHWDRVLLSAKESVYKAWYPLAGRWLDFADAALEFQPESGTFATRIDGRPVPGLVGRWLVTEDDLILTSAVAPAGPRGDRDHREAGAGAGLT